jgi:hypothetical protein
MPLVDLTFPQQEPLNVSIQVTDIIYVAKLVNDQAGTNHITGIDTKPGAWGQVVDVDFDANTIQVQTTGYVPGLFAQIPDIVGTHYLFFSKDKRANISGMLGYYAEVEYRNYSRLPAEMFATATEFVESSK